MEFGWPFLCVHLKKAMDVSRDHCPLLGMLTWQALELQVSASTAFLFMRVSSLLRNGRVRGLAGAPPPL